MAEAMITLDAAVCARKGLSLKLFRLVADVDSETDSPGILPHKSFTVLIKPSLKTCCGQSQIIKTFCDDGAADQRRCNSLLMVDAEGIAAEIVEAQPELKGWVNDNANSTKSWGRFKRRFSALLFESLFVGSLWMPREVELLLRPCMSEKRQLGAILCPSILEDDAEVVVARWSRPPRAVGAGPLERACLDYKLRVVGHKNDSTAPWVTGPLPFTRSQNNKSESGAWTPGLGDLVRHTGRLCEFSSCLCVPFLNQQSHSHAV